MDHLLKVCIFTALCRVCRPAPCERSKLSLLRCFHRRVWRDSRALTTRWVYSPRRLHQPCHFGVRAALDFSGLGRRQYHLVHQASQRIPVGYYSLPHLHGIQGVGALTLPKVGENSGNARVMRLLEFLTSYSYTLIYRKGSAYGNADVLSRLPIAATEHNHSAGRSRLTPTDEDDLVHSARPVGPPASIWRPRPSYSRLWPHSSW